MSMNPRIYLDHNATTPLGPAARAAIAAALDGARTPGNPSSIHAEGRAARDPIERARNQVAALLGRPREDVVFTSGGTEANALGVLGLAASIERAGGPRVVVASPVDHPSLRGAVAALAARGWDVRLAVDPATALAGAGLVAAAVVNHELGTRLAAGALIAAAHAAGARIHLDAVQAAGKLPLGELAAADAVAISAHKLGGPQGVGALALADPDALPLVDGGHQERGRRAGTENALGIVGFGAAAAAVDLAAWPAVAALGDDFERALVALGARIHGADQPRIGGTINAGFPGARGESVVVALDLAGIAVSTGAACTSGSVQPSPVLLALGYPDGEAREAVRFSLGRTTTAAELATVIAALPAIVARARGPRAPDPQSP